MRWVLAQNIENSLQMAVMVDIDGNKIVFYTQHEADIYIELILHSIPLFGLLFSLGYNNYSKKPT